MKDDTFISVSFVLLFFFFNDTATTEIYTLSLHDALPISRSSERLAALGEALAPGRLRDLYRRLRSEEHTSELQSRRDLVCRLLLEKKKKTQNQLLRCQLNHSQALQY